MTQTTIDIAGMRLEVFDAGAGAPMLFLHGGGGFDPAHEFVGLLTRTRRLVCPSHPGFGRSDLPDWLDSIDDIAYVYLELLDKLSLPKVDVVGCSVGGWIAAEMATKVPERITRLVLVAPVGVKVGAPDKLDIPDIWAMPQDEVNRLLYHDPERARIDPAKLSDEQLSIMLRNRESLALLTWEPWMHSTKLPHRLHRATMPTLFVRGASDGLVSEAYLQKYARLVPTARSTTIAAAGHAPQQEQPAAFASTVLSFLDH